MNYLFTKANLHRLIVGALIGAAVAIQNVIATGAWTWHALLFGILGGVLSGLAGWYISTKDPADTDSAPPASAGPTSVVGILLLLALLPLASCNPPAASAAPVLRSGPVGFAGALAPGDSLGPYTFTVGPVGGATGYKWTVTATATNGTWGNLPAGTMTATPSLTFTLAAVGGAWDSVALQLCVTGTSAVRSAKAPACTSWKVNRYLASPTALTGDSSRLAPISLMLRASPQDSVTRGGESVASHVLIGQSIQFCSIIRFGSGHVAGISPAPACAGILAANFRPDRLTLSGPEAAWLSGACGTWAACLAGFSVLVRADMLPHRA